VFAYIQSGFPNSVIFLLQYGLGFFVMIIWFHF